VTTIHHILKGKEKAENKQTKTIVSNDLKWRKSFFRFTIREENRY